MTFKADDPLDRTFVQAPELPGVAPTPGCVRAPPGRYLGDDPLRWSPDRLDVFLAAPFMREEAPSPTDPASEVYKPGFAEMVTLHPVRFDDVVPHGNEEACQYRTGSMAVDARGYGVAVFGNTIGPRDSTVVGYPVVARKGRVLGVRDGFACFLGAYEAPPVSEAHLFSPITSCPEVE